MSASFMQPRYTPGAAIVGHIYGLIRAVGPDAIHGSLGLYAEWGLLPQSRALFFQLHPDLLPK